MLVFLSSTEKGKRKIVFRSKSNFLRNIHIQALKREGKEVEKRETPTQLLGIMYI